MRADYGKKRKNDLLQTGASPYRAETFRKEKKGKKKLRKKQKQKTSALADTTL